MFDKYRRNRQKQLLSRDLSLWDYTISNDGSEIVASTFSDLYLINYNNSSSSLLVPASNDNFCISPPISSDDSLIIFQHKFGISSVNSDGSNENNIFASDSVPRYSQPVFTFDGKNFLNVYVNYYNEDFIRYSNLNGGSYNIYSYPGFHDISTGREDIKVSPYNIVAFAALAGENSKTFYIHRIDLNTEKDNILTDGYDVNYSFDYSKLTYLKPNDPNNAIYIYDLSTSTISSIKTNLQWANLFHPQLSLNMKFLVFEADSTYASYQY